MSRSFRTPSLLGARPLDSSPRQIAPSGNLGTAGFTLVELVVSALIASVFLGAVYQVLVTNQRVSVAQREQVAGHQTVRAGIDLLTQEIREVSASGGDLLVIEDDRIAFRALRAHGLACEVGSAGSPILQVAVMTRPFQSGETVYVFGDLDPETEEDDVWIEATIQDAQDGETCGADDLPAQDLTVSGLGTSDWDRVRIGALVRSWEEIEYGVQDYAGELYLVRIEDDVAARIVGPLDGAAGLQLSYRNATGAATAVPSDVRYVAIEMRTRSPAREQGGGIIADSLTTAVHLRN
jgi:prepilin-type N-terminal cleavage/methylation domain-containing protein